MPRTLRMTPAARKRQEERIAARENPRRSARSQARAPTTSAAGEASPSPDSSTTEPYEASTSKATRTSSKKPVQASRKRQKTSKAIPVKEPVLNQEEAALARAKAAWAKTKGRRGHLKMVVEMPFDLVLEVFGYLQPVDLLHLSMATKAMRGLVMDRTLALPLWKAAFQRVEPIPPSCPEGVSLPQWANFLYSRTCFNCNATHGLERSWDAVVKLCKTCMMKEFDVSIPWAHDAESIDNELRAITPSKHLKLPGSYGRRSLFYRPMYEKHKAALEALENDPVAREEYIKQAKLKYHGRSDSHWGPGGGASWQWAESRAKREDVRSRRTAREVALKEKLEDLGYKSVLKRLSHSALATLPGFGGVKPLTEKEWSKLHPLLVDVLDELQRTFQNKDWKSMVQLRTNAMQWMYMFYISHNRDKEPFAPRVGSLALMEPFRTMIYDTPPDQKLQHSDFLKHLSVMPGILDTWREEADEILLGLLPNQTPKETQVKRSGKGKEKELSLDRSNLSLATSLFSCKWCPEILTYPAVLSHGCLYRSVAQNRAEEGGKGKEPIEDEDVENLNARWNEGGEHLEFDSAASAYATAVIKALGEDPSTMTWEELDNANKRVECLRCRKDKGLKRLVMSWRAAILHEFDKHGEDDDNSYEGKWEALDDESVAVAHEKEKTSKNNSHLRPVAATRCCFECRKLGIGADGQVVYTGYGSISGHDATECDKGHDLTGDGATFYEGAWRMPFKSTPHPIKIA